LLQLPIRMTNVQLALDDAQMVVTLKLMWL